MATHDKPKRVKTGGRKAGTPNKTLHDVRVLAQGYGPEAIKCLRELMCSAEGETVRVAAARELLDRGYGKPIAQIAHTGANDGPIKVQDMPVLEQARRLAFIFDKAEREQGNQPGAEISPPQTH